MLVPVWEIMQGPYLIPRQEDIFPNLAARAQPGIDPDTVHKPYSGFTSLHASMCELWFCHLYRSMCPSAQSGHTTHVTRIPRTAFYSCTHLFPPPLPCNHQSVQKWYINEIMWKATFGGHLFSLSTVPLRLIQVCVQSLPLTGERTLWCGCGTFCCTVHPARGIWVIPRFGLLQMKVMGTRFWVNKGV